MATISSSSSSLPGGDTDRVSPERILELSQAAADCIERTGQEIAQINLQTRLLAFNAQVEAARAGVAGRCFGVVASEMVALSNRTQEAAGQLQNETLRLIRELSVICERLGSEVRGQRLSDLALANIDLIDRNLYERSCDCRWWAKDLAMVAALSAGATEEARRTASERMRVILDAYTVYFDIVLADAAGRIVANGCGGKHGVTGQEVGGTEWFRSAWATRSSDEFGFESVHASSLVGGQRVLVYSCKVCSEGRADGIPLGVLGVVFRWDALADTIVRATAVEEADRSRTRACIVTAEGLVIADSREQALRTTLPLSELGAVLGSKTAHAELTLAGRRWLVGYGLSPGFETYVTGWHSFVMQEL